MFERALASIVEVCDGCALKRQNKVSYTLFLFHNKWSENLLTGQIIVLFVCFFTTVSRPAVIFACVCDVSLWTYSLRRWMDRNTVYNVLSMWCSNTGSEFKSKLVWWHEGDVRMILHGGCQGAMTIKPVVTIAMVFRGATLISRVCLQPVDLFSSRCILV